MFEPTTNVVPTDVTTRAEHLCNRCGLPCECGEHQLSVTGGYLSTAGNGDGALDDMTRYVFSLCEFCLDALFCEFKIPPRVFDVMVDDPATILGTETWRSAAERVKTDEWRTFKAKFYAESARRRLAREGKRDV